MKYELETIPIWDSYKEDNECPLCLLKDKAEANYQKFFLGNSVMVPEMRIKVNATGFCETHFTRLFDSRDNRHGLGLISHTHFMEQKKWFQENIKDLTGIRAGKYTAPRISRLISELRVKTGKCMICERVEYTLKRYAFTIVYLWKKDDEFRETFQRSRGFCYPHLADILAMAGEILSGRLLAEFADETVRICSDSFDRLDKEVFWYTQKFDYQNNDKPWGTSKDALHRTIQKLVGKIQKDS
ncbi:MAG: hypothetical protein JW874_03310 [Spirochaetales bacterium]|nr:hypothetical protein [Spirochaetales bacterium]